MDDKITKLWSKVFNVELVIYSTFAATVQTWGLHEKKTRLAITILSKYLDTTEKENA